MKRKEREREREAEIQVSYYSRSSLSSSLRTQRAEAITRSAIPWSTAGGRKRKFAYATEEATTSGVASQRGSESAGSLFLRQKREEERRSAAILTPFSSARICFLVFFFLVFLR